METLQHYLYITTHSSATQTKLLDVEQFITTPENTMYKLHVMLTFLIAFDRDSPGMPLSVFDILRPKTSCF